MNAQRGEGGRGGRELRRISHHRAKILNGAIIEAARGPAGQDIRHHSSVIASLAKGARMGAGSFAWGQKRKAVPTWTALAKPACFRYGDGKLRSSRRRPWAGQDRIFDPD
jgi:hypothetical protein